MKKKTFLLLTLLCVLAQGVWAQTTVTTDQALRSAITGGANIKLGDNIDLSNSTLNIAGGTVTIDLNGYTLDRKLTKRGDNGGQVITVRKGATLHLSNGTLKGGWGGDGGGIVNEGGTVGLTNVTISGNTADDRGGGISNRGTLTMTDCTITGNTSNDRTAPEGGGGLFNANGATATLTNVSITGNVAKVKGGGGLCNYGTMTLDGCTVTGNSCQLNGGGIWTAAAATLNMQGKTTVTGNTTTNNATNNLFLKTRAVITVTGSLAGSDIGINMEGVTGTFTSGYGTKNSGVDPATIFTPDLALSTALSLTNGEVQLSSISEVKFIERSWNADSKQVVSTVKTLARQINHGVTPSEGEYKLVTSSSNENDVFVLGGYNNDIHEYYVVRGNVNHYAMKVQGKNVHLILCDGAKITLNGGNQYKGVGGILVPQGCNFYIHSQSYGASMGKLEAKSTNNGHAAGIGGYNTTSACDEVPGNIEIHGGDIYAQGGYRSAGIGGGEKQGGGSVVIYGGIVKAYSEDSYDPLGLGGAGIGGGFMADGGTLTVYDGKVYAYGGADAAGIGCGDGGYPAGNVKKRGGTVEIYGGYVEAYGGHEDTDSGAGGYAAGIGGGEYGDGANVTIHGGIVKAYGGTDASGIGGGENGNGGTLTVNGGEVYAYGNDYGAGIGGGQHGAGADVTINDGIVVAMAGRQAPPEEETENRAIGPGEGNDDYGKLTIAPHLMVRAGYDGENYERIFMAAERVGACWYRTSARIEPCTHGSLTYTIDGDTHTAHCMYCTTAFSAEGHTWENGICTVCGAGKTSYTVSVYLPDGNSYGAPITHEMAQGTSFNLPAPPDANTPDGMEFAGWLVAGPTGLSSFETNDNEDLLTAGTSYTVNENVSFTARYRYIDIILADDASNGEVLSTHDGMTAHSVTLSGRTLYLDGMWNSICLPFNLNETQVSQYLGDVALKTLSSSSFANGTLTMNFEDATSIEAGKPYIVKWDDTEGRISNPVFQNVTIDNTPKPVETQYVEFAGCFSPENLTEKDMTVLYLGDGNSLISSNEAMTINAFRAYFKADINWGDVNGDGIVSVSDVMALVNYVLDQKMDNFIIENADINGDGLISVADVMTLVNIVLGGNSAINVVVNGADGLTFGGTGSGPARAVKK